MAKEARFVLNPDQRKRLIFVGNSLRDAKLKGVMKKGNKKIFGIFIVGNVLDMFVNGVAYHHAGMDYSDRKQVEQTFAQGDLRALSTYSNAESLACFHFCLY